MNLAEQIELVEQIVKKDPDCTIKEYLEMIREIDGIRLATAIEITRENRVSIMSNFPELKEDDPEPNKKPHKGRPETPGRYDAKYLKTYKLRV